MPSSLTGLFAATSNVSLGFYSANPAAPPFVIYISVTQMRRAGIPRAERRRSGNLVAVKLTDGHNSLDGH